MFSTTHIKTYLKVLAQNTNKTLVKENKAKEHFLRTPWTCKKRLLTARGEVKAITDTSIKNVFLRAPKENI